MIEKPRLAICDVSRWHMILLIAFDRVNVTKAVPQCTLENASHSGIPTMHTVCATFLVRERSRGGAPSSAALNPDGTIGVDQLAKRYDLTVGQYRSRLIEVTSEQSRNVIA
ncbi:MAG: hypothetical protein IH611_05425 [Deltaproteobacteria bacterium]|nr:hypothetical protein [Deltaproteobacteria bacterium]